MAQLTIPEIERILSTAEIPETLQLYSGSKIINCRKFIDNSLAVLKANPGNKAFLGDYVRLSRFVELIQK